MAIYAKQQSSVSKTPVYKYKPPKQEVKQVDLSPLYRAIGERPKEAFNTTELRDLIMKMRDAGGQDVPVNPERFQTPEQIGNLVKQMTDTLEPLTQLQEKSATSAYNQAMQKLRSQWASRGLLASGGAMSQERQGAQELVDKIATIRAQQQANAIPLALDAARLALDEDSLKFNQRMANREFDFQRAQQQVAEYLRGLGFQEEQIQNYIRNMTNAKQLEIAQNQWAQEFGLQRENDNFNRWLATQQLNENARQFDKQFALQEGELTGNYIAHDARGLLETLLKAKQVAENPNSTSQERQRAHQMANDARIQLASMGYNIAPIDRNVDSQQAMLNLATFNPTQSERQRQFTNAVTEGELTGQYLSSEARPLLQRLLELKRTAETNKNLSASQRQSITNEAERIRQQLAAMGMNTDLIGKGISYDTVLSNLSQIKQNTLGQQELANQTAQVTGIYRDPKVQTLVNQLLALKKQSELGKGNAEASKTADRLRAQLASLGVNSDLFGKNVSYAQALKNAQSIGMPTEAARQFDKELAENARQFDSKLNYDWASLAEDARQHDENLQFKYDDLAFRQEKLRIETELKKRGLDLKEAQIDIQRIRAEQESQKMQGKQMSDAATTEAIGKVLKQKSRDDAIAYIAKNAKTFAENRVDIQKVLKALDSKYPSASKVFESDQWGELFGGK